ncbi:GntR family transcriptional regulator [Paremcibacter congregatus]|tara:strand:- start:13655 stop:14038 length:384 start_codon:yes stop_codon:yes gene_type:complete
MMEITIDIEDTVPLYAQLVTQIKQAVMDGAIAPGDPLPSIRQLANDLEMNNKTVAKAYQLLERDSVIQTKGYRGTYIHPDARANSMVDVNDLVVATLEKAITTLRNAGATDSEIRIAFANILNNKTA